MTDPKQTLRDARARMKPLVARLLARRDQARANLDARVAERARLAAEAAASGGPPDLATALASALSQLDLQIGQDTEAHAQADAAFREAAADLQQLAQDEDDAERATLRAVVDAASRAPGDLGSLDPADIALRHVREHAANLEAQVGLDRELARDGGGVESSRVGGSPGAPATPVAPQDPEARARAELAALKEARKNKRSL